MEYVIKRELSEKMKFKTACVQLTSGNDIAANIEKISKYIAASSAEGADLVLLPENCFFMDGASANFPSGVFEEGKHPGVMAVRALAEKFSKYILIGSCNIASDQSRVARVEEAGEITRLSTLDSNHLKATNTSYLVAPDGSISASYDKIHLFDAEPQGDRKYTESEKICAGDKVVTAPLPWGVLGMSVCYDVRFSYLYRKMATEMNAIFFSVPAAFTVPTGKAHWEILLRARAIENGAYVFAAAQAGEHPNGRKTYGHSMIINPWGEVIAELDEGEGIITAEIDTEMVTKSRAAVPSLKHGKEL